MKKRVCFDCKVEKPVDRFTRIKNVNKTDTVYYRPYCKECSVIRSREWQKKNTKHYYAYQKKYVKEHIDKLRIYWKERELKRKK